MVNVTAILVALVAAFALSAAVTPLVRRVATARNLVARPTEDRWHRETVALGGGFAIVIAFAIVAALTAPARSLAPLVLCAGAMFTLGALDDLYHFRPSSKLVVQTLIAAVAVVLLPSLHITGIAALDAFIALVWIVGVTNAFNLLDNMDGLSAGVASIAGMSYLIAIAPDPSSPLVLPLAAFVGAVLGFLIYNRPPASIFMGDSGSLFLGAFLACTALIALAHPAVDGPVGLLVPVLILLVPIFDTVFVSVTRLLASRSPMHGGRDHLSHRLVAMGVDVDRAVGVLHALAAVGGIGAVSLGYVDGGWVTVLIAGYVIILAWLGVVLSHVATHDDDSDRRQQPLVSEVSYANRAVEIVLDLALIALAYYIAFRLRFQGAEFGHFLIYFAGSFPLVIACQLAGLALAGKYRHVSRSLDTKELIVIARGIGYGVAGSMLVLLTVYRFEGFSRLVFAIDVAALSLLLVGARVVASSVDEHLRKRRGRGRPALVYGAGVNGALLVRVLLEDPAFELLPVGFIDDDPAKRRQRVEGVPVTGRLEDLASLLDAGGVEQLIISTKAVDRARLAEIAAICRQRGVQVRSFRFALDDIGPVASVRHVQSR